MNVVTEIPALFPKLRKAVLDALVDDDIKKASEIIQRQIDNFSGSDRTLIVDLLHVKDLIRSLRFP